MTRERTFKLHLHCSNCQRPSVMAVPVPAVDGAPSTVDEFIEMVEHYTIPFHCRHCESLIGQLVGVTMERKDEAA